MTTAVGPGVAHTFAVIGDIGENADANKTVTRILGQTFDSGILSGDIAYASGCESSGCGDWDAFQRMMSPMTSTIPWSISVGNHETYE